MLLRVSKILPVGFFISFLFGRSSSLPDVIKIGGLFDSSDDEQEMAFRTAVDWLNRDPELLPASRLVAVVARLEEGDSYAASKKGMIRFQDFFRETVDNGWNIQLYTFEDHVPYREVFRKMKKDLAKLKQFNQKFILDVSKENLFTVLKHAQQVGMVTENQQYLITCLDLHTIDLEDFKYGKASIRGFRLVQESNDEYKRLLQEVTARTRFSGNGKNQRFGLQTETTLMYDAVKVFTNALKEIDNVKKVDEFPSVSCTSGAKGMDGTTLINYMKSSSMNGMTGLITFDGEGFRSFFKLDLMFLSEEGFSEVGTVFPGVKLNQEDTVFPVFKLTITKNTTAAAEFPQPKYRITTIVDPPYVMLRNSTKGLTGNERFEGFCIDLIEYLSEILHFSYEFFIVTDNNYGKKNKTTGNWTGLIGDVISKKADMAVAGLSINSRREEAVDFTMPFMNTGISILFRKPTTKVKSLFSFLSPFSGVVWLYLLASYLAVSIVMYWVGRLTPYEWINNHPCRQDDVIVENTFNFRNGLWFMMGSLMQQGSDLIPTAFCTRTVASFWNFFTLIMVSSYTANLAAFLTVEKVVYPIENVHDLAKQTKIKYGCNEGGSTRTFFEESNNPVYQKVWNFMSKSPTGFLNTTQEGVEKVKQGNYAFFMESATIRYLTERQCTLTEIGGLLDSKGYGIAVMKGNRDLASWLSSGILQLQEDGTIHNLKEKWWKQKGGGHCGVSKQYPSTVSKLGLGNVGGVFVVLIFGLIIATLMALLEFWWKTRHLDNPNEDSFWVRIMKELKFALLCANLTKPATSYRKSSAPQSTLNSRSSIPSQVTNKSV